MKNITITDISYLIQSTENCDLHKINLAISQISEMLKTENVRASQIRVEIEKSLTPTAITKLQNHLVQLQENIQILNIFIKILFSKKTTTSSSKISYKNIKEKIDFNPKNISYLI